jgi:hypothetical protein
VAAHFLCSPCNGPRLLRTALSAFAGHETGPVTTRGARINGNITMQAARLANGNGCRSLASVATPRGVTASNASGVSGLPSHCGHGAVNRVWRVPSTTGNPVRYSNNNALIQDDAYGVSVAPSIDAPRAACLLWRNLLQRAVHSIIAGQAGNVDLAQRCHGKVERFWHMSRDHVRRSEEPRGLEIAMNDAVAVASIQGQQNRQCSLGVSNNSSQVPIRKLSNTMAIAAPRGR